jgi:hypothetical protein
MLFEFTMKLLYCDQHGRRTDKNNVPDTYSQIPNVTLIYQDTAIMRLANKRDGKK